MKPLESQERRDNKLKKRNMALGIIIAVVLVAGTVGWALSGGTTEKSEEYNGFTFVQVQNYWQTIVKLFGQDFPLHTTFLPKEVENITGNTIGLTYVGFVNKNLYILANSGNERQAANDILVNFQNLVNRIQFACLEEDSEDSFCADKPIKSCEDVSEESAIIVIKDSESTSLKYENGCLTIEGSNPNLKKATDKALFVMFEVM
ncbi:MAG: hypothetical protein JSW08_02640 [archaeon]|nr:MAG: hypothetical protein JSW08_02640 [archaeon]